MIAVGILTNWYYKQMKFKEAIRKQAECRRYLHAIQLLQEGVYGKSYLDDGGEDSTLCVDAGELAEEFAATFYEAEIDRQRGHDILKKCGLRVEVKFRRLALDSNSSAYYATVDKLNTKDADKLFYVVYNPITQLLDGFEYNSGDFQDSITVRWSSRDQDYTEKGGKNNRIQLPQPKDLFRKKIIHTFQSEDYDSFRKVCRGYSWEQVMSLLGLQ